MGSLQSPANSRAAAAPGPTGLPGVCSFYLASSPLLCVQRQGLRPSAVSCACTFVLGLNSPPTPHGAPHTLATLCGPHHCSCLSAAVYPRAAVQLRPALCRTRSSHTPSTGTVTRDLGLPKPLLLLGEPHSLRVGAAPAEPQALAGKRLRGGSLARAGHLLPLLLSKHLLRPTPHQTQTVQGKGDRAAGVHSLEDPEPWAVLEVSVRHALAGSKEDPRKGERCRFRSPLSRNAFS